MLPWAKRLLQVNFLLHCIEDRPIACYLQLLIFISLANSWAYFHFCLKDPFACLCKFNWQKLKFYTCNLSSGQFLLSQRCNRCSLEQSHDDASPIFREIHSWCKFFRCQFVHTQRCRHFYHRLSIEQDQRVDWRLIVEYCLDRRLFQREIPTGWYNCWIWVIFCLSWLL